MLVEPEEHLQGPGPSEQDPVHAAHDRRLPVRRARPGARASTSSASSSCKRQAEQGGVLGFLQLFSGGALTQFAVFALGIMPYITARSSCRSSRVVIPKLEEWQEQGAVGQRKITQWTRYLTIAHRPAAGDRPHVPVPQRRRRASSARQRAPPRPAARTSPLPRVAARRAHPHRRHRAADVDGRAHHPARHRQRHVAADLRLGRQSTLPSRAAPASRPRGGTSARHRPGRCSRSSSWSAIVFVEQGQRRIPVQFAKRVVGPPHVRRPEHLHPAEGQPGRRHPDHLRQLGALPAGAARRTCCRPTGWGDASSSSSTTTWCSPTTSCYIVICTAC